MELRASDRVRAWRKHLGWTVKRLAGATGIHKATLHRIDRGIQQPRVLELEAIVDALQIDMATLYGDPPAEEGAQLTPLGAARATPAASNPPAKAASRG